MSNALSLGWDNPLLGRHEGARATLKAQLAIAGKRRYDTAMAFSDLDTELRALDEGTALVDLTDRGLVVITGEDRATWLHGLCTQDVKGLGPGQGGRACHIDIKGRIQADFRLAAFEEMLLLDVESGVGGALKRLLRRFVVMEKVKITDRTAATGVLGLLGPGAAALLKRATGQDVSALPNHHVLPADLGGEDVLIAATDQFGAKGYRITAPREAIVGLWDSLLDMGGPDLTRVGKNALETARIRAFMPRFGADLGADVLFNEAELTDAVSYTKGCYLGQEVVERVDARGRIGRRLMGLKLDIEGDALPESGATIANDKRKLGHLTSIALVGGEAFGMGFVHRADNAPGTQVKIQGDNVSGTATLIER